MKPNLYICHTAYQVLVDLLRAGRCACENGPHTMVLSASVPDTAALAARWWAKRPVTVPGHFVSSTMTVLTTPVASSRAASAAVSGTDAESTIVWGPFSQAQRPARSRSTKT